MRESFKFFSWTLHLTAVQEGRETRNETYIEYVERVLEGATQQRVKTLDGSWIDSMYQSGGCKVS